MFLPHRMLDGPVYMRICILAFFSALLRGKMMAIFQIWGDFPVEKLKLKMPSNSCLAHGPRALRNVGGISSAPGAPLVKRRWFTAAYSFMKASALVGGEGSTLV